MTTRIITRTPGTPVRMLRPKTNQSLPPRSSTQQIHNNHDTPLPTYTQLFGNSHNDTPPPTYTQLFGNSHNDTPPPTYTQLPSNSHNDTPPPYTQLFGNARQHKYHKEEASSGDIKPISASYPTTSSQESINDRSGIISTINKINIINASKSLTEKDKNESLVTAYALFLNNIFYDENGKEQIRIFYNKLDKATAAILYKITMKAIKETKSNKTKPSSTHSNASLPEEDKLAYLTPPQHGSLMSKVAYFFTRRTPIHVRN